MAKVYIVHGYTASAEKHWFPWLEKALGKEGVTCERLTMPHSENPSPEQWLAHLEQVVSIDAETVVIGHSLGCVSLMTFLARHYERPAGAIFVSGFYQPLETLPQLTPFSNLYAISPPLMNFKSFVVAALNDSVVPHSYSDALAQHLKADYIRLPQGGHFLDREGCTEFPLILDLIRQLLNR